MFKSSVILHSTHCSGSNASNKDTYDTLSDDDATEDTILLEELELDTNSQGESVKHELMDDYCASPIIR
jgi:hypothetical protein